MSASSLLAARLCFMQTAAQSSTMPSPPKAKIDTMPKMRAGPARVKGVFSETFPTRSFRPKNPPPPPQKKRGGPAEENQGGWEGGGKCAHQRRRGPGPGQAAKTPHAMEGRHV